VSRYSRTLVSNFATGPTRQLPMNITPTQWELLLADMQISEEDAQCLLEQTGEKSRQLRRWIHKHHDRLYVPTKFLTAEQMENCR
jgi:hypothetical protein